jgi:iron complex outermembrane receptor protein
MQLTRSIFATLAVGAILAVAPKTGLPAPTDAAGPADAADAAAPATLEEVTVTARKRSETFISVPVVITAINKTELQNRAIDNLDDIARIVPQLLIGNQSGSVQGGNISIRGIAGPDSNPFGDQAVSFNIDGVSIAKAFVRRMADTDLDQVEVLKGPQALFFGKNSPAGVVSIRTADPTSTFEADTKLGYELVAHEYRTEDYVSGPITDTLGARLSGYFSTMQGYLSENTPASTGYEPGHSREPEAKDWAIRGTLKWDPSALFSAKLKLNFGSVKDDGPAANTEFNSCPFGARESGSGIPCGVGNASTNSSSGPVVGTIPGTLNFYGNGQNFQSQDQILTGLELNFHPSDVLTVTSVTGYYRNILYQCQNYENDTGINLPSCNAPTTDTESSEELRMTSDFKGPLNFAAGAFMAKTRAESGSLTYAFGSPAPLFGFFGAASPVVVDDYYLIQDGTAYSGYLQAIYKPIDVIEIDAGGRYSYEKKTLPEVLDGGGISEGGCGFGAPGVPCTSILGGPGTNITSQVSNSKSWNDFSPEGTISYRPSQDLTIFGSWKHGFLSGGFNSSSVNFRAEPDISYNPEVIKGFELGVKSLLLDRTLAVNGAAYTYKVTGLQVTDFTNATSTIRNAGAVKISGLEADANYKTPIQGLDIHGAASYNQAKYTSFVGAPCYNGETIAEGCTITGGNPTQNLSGTELIRAPKWNNSLGVGYGMPLANRLKIGVSVDADYSSSYLTDASSAPQSREPAFTLLDSTIRLADQNDAWEAEIIGRNLSNKHYWVASPNVPFTGSGQGTTAGVLGDRFAAVSRGREILLQVGYKFK